MRLLRLLPWLVGLAVVVFTLAGANKLIQAQATGLTGGTAAAKAAPPVAAGDSLVTHGTVAAEVEIGQYTGTPFMQSGRVEKLFVKEGDEVKAGTPLYLFDDKGAKADLAAAEANVQVAEKQKAVAIHRLTVEYPSQLRHAEDAVKTAEQSKAIAEQSQKAAVEGFDKQWRVRNAPDSSPKRTQAEMDAERKNDRDVLQAELAINNANIAVLAAKSKVDELKNAPYAEAVAASTAAVELAKTARDKAQLVLDECTVRAKADGVVEQITTAPGRLIGPTNATPLLYLVPQGNRIVRAEVQPDFAFKLKDRTGQTAVIQDDNNPTYTYEGTVRHVGGSFLPKRGGGGMDLLNGKTTLVLEVVIEVKDPTPPGKPPLRVGQPVRVSIQQ